MPLHPSINEDVCAAHGDCAEIAPDVFIVDGDVAAVIGTGPDDLLMQAAQACPAVAIILTDDAGQQVYP